jgi:glycosyltransferase involved in cell wall biosynthesis
VKILLVHNEYKLPGGEDEVVRQEKGLLQRAGHQVTAYIRNNRELDDYSTWQRMTMAPRAAWAWDAKKEFEALLANESPQVVHVHNTLTLISPSVYWACAEAGVPVVQTLHNFRLFCPAGTYLRDGQVCEECHTHSLWKSVQYGCYRGSRPASATVALTLAAHRALGTYREKIQAYIAFHDFARGKFIEGGIPAERIFIKPNFVSPDPGEGAGDGNYVLFVGRLSPEKGILTMLRAWERLDGRVPLVIAGDGPLRPQVEEAAARVTGMEYRGQIPRDKILSAMKAARLLVFPSEWYEGFPLTIAEAFACGLPVAASRLGAMEVLIEDGRTGLHFEPGNPDDLARKVEAVWGEADRLRRMGREARQEFLAHYTAEKNYDLLMDIYRRAIEARH